MDEPDEVIYLPDRRCQCCDEWIVDSWEKPYCQKCIKSEWRRKKHGKRMAKLSKWASSAAGPKGVVAAQLSYELVYQLGGLEAAAKEIAYYYREAEENGASPDEVLRMLQGVLRMIERSLPEPPKGKWKHMANPGGKYKKKEDR